MFRTSVHNQKQSRVIVLAYYAGEAIAGRYIAWSTQACDRLGVSL